jgi:hypothetical protein
MSVSYPRSEKRLLCSPIAATAASILDTASVRSFTFGSRRPELIVPGVQDQQYILR